MELWVLAVISYWKLVQSQFHLINKPCLLRLIGCKNCQRVHLLASFRFYFEMSNKIPKYIHIEPYKYRHCQLFPSNIYYYNSNIKSTIVELQFVVHSNLRFEKRTTKFLMWNLSDIQTVSTLICTMYMWRAITQNNFLITMSQWRLSYHVTKRKL